MQRYKRSLIDASAWLGDGMEPDGDGDWIRYKDFVTLMHNLGISKTIRFPNITVRYNIEMPYKGRFKNG